MIFARRQFLRLAAGSAVACALARVAVALDYPIRPVHLIVGFPPGGAADITARLIAQWLSERLGQQFIVENRPGAGTNIGTEAVVRAPADGYALLLVSVANAVNATLYERLNFNFVRDIAPVAGLIRGPLAMDLNPSVAATTVPDFISYARANPGAINIASAGNGTPGHMAVEMFKIMTGLNLVHVPYRGAAPAMTDLLAGQVQVVFDNLPTSLEHVRAGKIRALAVTSAARSPALPDVPALAEFVPGYEVSSWFGIGAPKETPTEIVALLNTTINAALADPALQARFAEMASAPIAMTPAQFGLLIADETEKWAMVIRFAGVSAADR